MRACGYPILLFCGVLALSCHPVQAADIDITGATMTLTLGNGETVSVTRAAGGSSFTITSAAAITRTGAGGGAQFPASGAPGASAGDYVVAAVTQLNVTGAGTLRFTGAGTTDFMPAFSVANTVTSFLANGALATNNQNITIGCVTTLETNSSFRAGTATASFNANVLGNAGGTASFQIVGGASGNALLSGVAGTVAAPLASFSATNLSGIAFTGNVQTAGGLIQIDTVGLVQLNGTLTFDTDISGGATAAGDVAVTNVTGLDPFAGGNTVTFTVDASSGSAGAAGSVNLPGLGLNVNFGSVFVIAGDLTLRGGVNSFATQSYEADTLALNAPLSSVIPGGTLIVRPHNPATVIGLGTTAGGTLQLDDAEILDLQSALGGTFFNTVTIGSVNQTGQIKGKGTLPFIDPISMLAQGTGGSIDMSLATINATDNASVTLRTKNGNITTAAISTVNQGIVIESNNGGAASGVIAVNSPGITTNATTASGSISVRSIAGPLVIASMVRAGPAAGPYPALVSMTGSGSSTIAPGVQVGGDVSGLNVTVTGAGGSTATDNDGIFMVLNGSIFAANQATLSGTSGNPGSGVVLNAGTLSTADGLISVTSSGTKYGTFLNGAAVSATGTGTITFTANSTGNDSGLYAHLGSISSNSGSIDLTGTAGVSGNEGFVNDIAVTSTSGTITISGTATNPGTIIGANIGGTVSTGAAGNVSITGTSSGTSAGVKLAASTQGVNGIVSITGTALGNADGVSKTGGNASASGTGAITILGITSGTTAVAGVRYTAGTITSNGGQIRISGKSNSATAAEGIVASSTITAGGTGNVFLTGTAANPATRAVNLDTGANISNAANIAITGSSGIRLASSLTCSNVLTLKSDGTAGIAQSTGVLTAVGLRILGTGPLTFNTANAADTIAGTFTGALNYTQAAALDVNTLTSVVAVPLPTALAAANTDAGLFIQNDLTLFVNGANNRMQVLSNISSSGASATTTLLRSNGDVQLSNATIVAQVALMNVYIAPDANADNNGCLRVLTSSMDSKGGEIILSGGNDPSPAALRGTGFASSTAATPFAVQLVQSSIVSGAGNITLRGASHEPLALAYGIFFQSNTGITKVESTTGSITVIGLGGPSAASEASGVRLEGDTGDTASDSHISTFSGPITITGTGGTATSSADGVVVTSGFDVASTSGTVDVTGVSTSASSGSDGIEVSSAASVSSVSGNVTLKGSATAGNREIFVGLVGGDGPPTVRAGGAALSLQAVTTVGQGVVVNNGTLGGLLQSGPIGISAQEIDFTGTTNVQGTGALTLAPNTNGLPIFVGNGGGAGSLDFSATEIACIANGFSGITIGAPTGTAALTLHTATFNDPVTFLEAGAGGSIVLAGPLTGADNASFTLNAPLKTLSNGIATNVQPITFTGGLTLAAANLALATSGSNVTFDSLDLSTFTLSINGNLGFAPASVLKATLNGVATAQHGGLAVTGAVNLTNASLSLQTGFQPAPTDAIVLIDNDAADAVAGAFASQPEGTIVSLMGRILSLTYRGGTGNDVLLLNLPPVITSFTKTPTNPVSDAPVSFVVAAADPEGQPVTLNFDYGDGSTGTSLTHTYSGPGNFIVTVTASDGTFTTTAQLTVSFGTEVTNTFRVGVRLHLGSKGGDTIQAGGFIFIPQDLSLTGKTLTLNIGGNEETFTFDARGRGTNSHGTIVLPKARSRNQDVHFTVRIRNANYLPALQMNPPLDARGLPTDINVTLTLADIALQASIPLKFTGRAPRFKGIGQNFRPLRF